MKKQRKHYAPEQKVAILRRQDYSGPCFVWVGAHTGGRIIRTALPYDKNPVGGVELGQICS
jgi:hypothetical protein